MRFEALSLVTLSLQLSMRNGAARIDSTTSDHSTKALQLIGDLRPSGQLRRRGKLSPHGAAPVDLPGWFAKLDGGGREPGIEPSPPSHRSPSAMIPGKSAARAPALT